MCGGSCSFLDLLHIHFCSLPDSSYLGQVRLTEDCFVPPGTGENLWKALVNGVGGNYPGDGRFPQISGFKFSFDASKPVGCRIVEVTRLDGTAIAKDSKEYTLTTLDFLIYGGDGYVDVFTPSKARVQGALLDVFVEALRADMAAKKVTQLPAADGRIKKVG